MQEPAARRTAGEGVRRAHDPETEKSLVIPFETEDDYRQGDEMLNAMPAGIPRAARSVKKYDVAVRMSV